MGDEMNRAGRYSRYMWTGGRRVGGRQEVGAKPSAGWGEGWRWWRIATPSGRISRDFFDAAPQFRFSTALFCPENPPLPNYPAEHHVHTLYTLPPLPPFYRRLFYASVETTTHSHHTCTPCTPCTPCTR